MERVPIYIVLFLLISSIFHSSFDNSMHVSFSNSPSVSSSLEENQLSILSANCPVEHHTSAPGNHCCHHIPAFLLPNLFRYFLQPVQNTKFISAKVLVGIFSAPLRRPPKNANSLI